MKVVHREPDHIKKQIRVFFYIAFQIGFAVWAYRWWKNDLLPPGYSVALIALVAAVMALQGEMKGWQKFLWMLILAAFLKIEFRAISVDRAENDRKQKDFFDAQKEGFQKIARQANDNFGTTTKGLTDAISKLRTVLGTTETVVENVTGGNSYAYVYPKFELGSIGPVYLFIHNNGDQILSGVSIKVDRVVSGTYDGTYHDLHSIRLKELIPVGGTLAAHWGAMLTNSETIPQLGPDRKATYLVLISAQNGGATEEIYFRPSNGGNSLAYQFKVWTKAYGKRRPSDFFNGIQWTRCVMTSDWIEPGQTPPADIQK